jgi:hypothetical protein
MPEAKRSLKVFLCYAHSDKDAVKVLYTRLTKDGVDVWFDKEKLLGGADWEYEIRNAVRGSDVVVVCHSKQFNQKGFRQKEVNIALEETELLPKGEIFLIPARLEECDVLDDLKRWHWVDLFESDGYERLLRALHARADKIGATLQAYKSWLPGITNPHLGQQKLITPKNRIEEKRKPEKQPRKLKAESIFAILGAIAIIIFAALIGILPQVIKPAPAPTATMNVATTATAPFSVCPKISCSIRRENRSKHG